MTCKYNMGDVFYVAKKNFNLAVKKIFMTDENGIEWYRYEKDPITYTVERAEIVGRIWAIAEGEISKDFQESPGYKIKFFDGNTEQFLELEIDNIEDSYYRFFLTKEEAKAYVENEVKKLKGKL